MVEAIGGYSFQRYLAAKRSVDDRALNRHVWETLHSALATHITDTRPLTVLEIGGGIGTMVERLLEEGRLPPTHYHVIDEQTANIAEAYSRMEKTFAVATFPKSVGTSFALSPTHALTVASGMGHPLHVELYASDLYDFLAQAGSLVQVDLLLAHAFMDLVDVPTTLPLFTRTLHPGALLYFTINFDGATILEPTIDAAFDGHIEAIYHQTMDERITNGKRSGDSHTGRHLFHQLKSADIHTVDAGSSDWVVIPQHNGNGGSAYPHDEAYFLHFIIHTMHGALRQHPQIDTARFDRWIAMRHAQIEAGELVYIAHQLDYLGEYQPTATGASMATSRPSA